MIGKGCFFVILVIAALILALVLYTAIVTPAESVADDGWIVEGETESVSSAETWGAAGVVLVFGVLGLALASRKTY